MIRIACIFGAVTLVKGIWGTVSPRFGFAVWEQYLRPHLPASLNSLYADYSRLSDRTLQYLSLWSAVVGLIMLTLAGRTRR